VSARDCLRKAVADGKLSAEGFETYERYLTDAERRAEQSGLSGPSAYTFAATEAAKEMADRARSVKSQVATGIVAIDRAWEQAGGHSVNRFWGMLAVLGENVRGGGVSSSIVARHRAVYATLQSFTAEFLDGLQSKAAGLVRDRALPVQTVRALYGVDTGDQASMNAAKTWAAATDHALGMLRRAGVPIGQLEDWRLPQRFDPLAVRALNPDGFRDLMADWWQRGRLRLRDWEGEGKAYLMPGRDDDRVREILDRAYTNITTDGTGALEPGALRTATLADKYGRRRAFEWADAEAWHDFNRTMGVTDDGIGELMIGHMNQMSRDIAVAQVLGPDPDRAAKILLEMYAKEGGSKFTTRMLANVFEQAAGHASTPVSERMALAGQGIRSGLASAQLGGAVLSATTDFQFTRATASWNGLEMTQIGAEYVKGLNPANKAHRIEAMRSGLILDVGLSRLGDAMRDNMTDVWTRRGSGTSVDTAISGFASITGRAAEFIMRAQGLSIHTQAMRDGFGMIMQGHFADVAGNAFDKLSAIDRRTLGRYGITADDWELLRTKTLDRRSNGVAFMDPARLAREGTPQEQEAALKMIGAIAAEQRFAVPEGNAVTRALVLGATRPGTVEGEFLRAAWQYKGFPLAVTIMHGFRMMDTLADANGQWFRGSYAAGMMVMLTSLGALTLQLKNIAGGKDPEPMDTAKFWARAAAQGGVGGIVTDMAKQGFAAQSATDVARLLSPTAGFAWDLQQLTLGQLGQRFDGKEPKFSRDAVNFAGKYTPDVWYTRLAMDRLVWDTLQKAADPDAAGTFARIEERARKDQNTRFWWRPGSTSPRAPDLSRAVQ